MVAALRTDCRLADIGRTGRSPEITLRARVVRINSIEGVKGGGSISPTADSIIDVIQIRVSDTDDDIAAGEG